MSPKTYNRLTIFAGILAFLAIPFIFWCGGYNFERNDTGMFCAFLTVLVTVFVTGVMISMKPSE